VARSPSPNDTRAQDVACLPLWVVGRSLHTLRNSSALESCFQYLANFRHVEKNHSISYFKHVEKISVIFLGISEKLKNTLSLIILENH
jgi:hypothetical protein